MTLRSEYKDIFTKWDGKVRYDIIYNCILKWISKYKNIVKDQESIDNLINSIYEYDMNQINSKLIYISNPNLTKAF